MKRIRRRRTRGFRLPPNTVCVDRTTKIGNPFDWRDGVEIGGEAWAKRVAVDMLKEAIAHPERFPDKQIPTREQIVNALRGKDFVACFCKEEDPCHGDFYIEIARATAREEIRVRK